MSQNREAGGKPKSKRRRRRSSQISQHTITPPTMSGKNKEKDGLTQNNSSGACGTSNQTLAIPNPFMPASLFNPVTAPQNPWMSDFSQKLEFIMSKMSTLDTIVSKQNAVLTRRGDIENRLDKHSKEISELQKC